MKNLIFAGILVSFNGTLLSQAEKPSWVSPARDTLYLEDTNFGRVISRSWRSVPLNERPKIVFKDPEWIRKQNSATLPRDKE
jgi:hypothetical protein